MLLRKALHEVDFGTDDDRVAVARGLDVLDDLGRRTVGVAHANHLFGCFRVHDDAGGGELGAHLFDLGGLKGLVHDAEALPDDDAAVRELPSRKAPIVQSRVVDRHFGVRHPEVACRVCAKVFVGKKEDAFVLVKHPLEHGARVA